jgi:hypothetical protein
LLHLVLSKSVRFLGVMSVLHVATVCCFPGFNINRPTKGLCRPEFQTFRHLLSAACFLHRSIPDVKAHVDTRKEGMPHSPSTTPQAVFMSAPFLHWTLSFAGSPSTTGKQQTASVDEKPTKVSILLMKEAIFCRLNLAVN